MDDDSRVIDKGWDALPDYGNKSGDADEAVTVSISTTPGEWLVNTVDAVVVPMSMAELVDGLRTHKLTERSLVWRAGMQEWAAVERVPQLKLAARMSVTTPSAAPPRPTPAAVATPSKPPPKPVRPTPAPQRTPPQFATSPSTPPQSLPSRKSTLPFGLQTPAASQSRPNHLRPSSSPRAALPPPASKDEPEVLAVYDRPAATISFDLSPVQPLRSLTPASAPPPQTLAPTTTDSAQRRAPVPRNADLSVVAASQFRDVQRSSKRLVWVSSLVSAAAASLLTFWASSGAAPGPTAIVEPSPAAAAAAAIPPVAARPAPVTATSEPSPAPVEAHDSAPSDSAPSAASAAPAKPKSARRAKAVNLAPAPHPVRVEADQPDTAKDPSTEPNPYDVKLDEDRPAAKSAPVAHGSGLEADSKTSEASASGSTSPGF